MRIPQKMFDGIAPDFEFEVKRFGKTIGMMLYIIADRYYLNMSKPEGLEAYEIDRTQYEHYLYDYNKSFADLQSQADSLSGRALEMKDERLRRFYARAADAIMERALNKEIV